MRLALTRATSRTKISVLSRREQYVFKKHASRLHESNIRKTNVAPVDAIRIFIWKILLSSRRYALFYLTPERFLLKMSVERQSCALSTDTLFYNDVLAKTQRKSCQKWKNTSPSAGYAKPILLRVVTSLGSVATRGLSNHAGGETPRIVTLRVAARGLFFFVVNAIKSYKKCICSQKSIKYYPQSVTERPHGVKKTPLHLF